MKETPEIRSILIVDDTAKNIQVLGNLLKAGGYRINAARSGRQALELLTKISPDLILLDIMMPDMDGFETCRRLKAKEQTVDIPVIFLSARVETEDIVQGFELGAVDYITKPFHSTELLARVQTHLQLRESLALIEQQRLKLQERTEQLELVASKLSKYLSPQVYDSIFSGERDVLVEATRKKLTIFFSDIKGFTELTDSMEPEDLSNLLNTYLTEMTRIAINYGGTIDKFIGDAILIFFGDPVSSGEQDDARACIFMALEMRECMKTLRKKWVDEGVLKPLRIRIGINSGYCAVGNFGSEERVDYTAIGNQVNLASRLESNAVTDQILISHDTYAQVKDIFHCEKKEEIFVKGMAYPVQTYQVIDIRDHTREFQLEAEGFELTVDLNMLNKEEAVFKLEGAIKHIQNVK